MEENKQAPVEHPGESAEKLPYTSENLLSAARLDFETIEMYRQRRTLMNKVAKKRKKGSMYFLASTLDSEGTRRTATFRKADYPEVYNSTESEVRNEKADD